MDPGSIPEIRIRKGSDAPSLGEVREICPAPLASFEALSDLDESEHGSEGELSRQTSQDTGPIPVYHPPPPAQDEDQEDEPDTPTQEDWEGGSFHTLDGSYQALDSPEEDQTGAEPGGYEALDAGPGYEVLDTTLQTAPTSAPVDLDFSAFDMMDSAMDHHDTADDVFMDTDRSNLILPLGDLSGLGGGDKKVAPPRPPGRPKSPSKSSTPGRPPPPRSPVKSPMRPRPPKSPVKSPGPRRPPPPGGGPRKPPRNTGDSDLEDSELADIHQTGASGDEDLPDDHKSGRASLDTSAIERPRSRTPKDAVSLGDYISADAAGESEDSNVEKIKISLPGKEFKNRPKSPRRTPQEAADSWMSFNQGPGNNGSSLMDTEEDDGDADKKSSKRPAPPPPPSGGFPKRPPPPKFKPGMKKSWEMFDASQPTPPKKPSRGGVDADDPFSVQPGHESNMSSFDDESALFDPHARPEKEKEKEKKKSKGLSAKKLINMAKSPRKHGKKNKEEDWFPTEEEIARYSREASEEKLIEVGKDSDQWKAFEQMQTRIKASVEKTQETLHKLEKTTSAKNSPWKAFGADDGDDSEGGSSELTSPQASWEGFEDSFEVTPNLVVSKQLPHIGVSPLPSPKHPPVPPHNSRRGSMDEKSDDNGVADLLGLISGDSSQPKSSGILQADLLGLDSDTTAEIAVTAQKVSADILALSRNPDDESAHSSSRSSPNPFEDSGPIPAASSLVDEVDKFIGLDLLKAEEEKKKEEEEKKQKELVSNGGASGGLDFLGLQSDSGGGTSCIPIDGDLMQEDVDPFDTSKALQQAEAAKAEAEKVKEEYLSGAIDLKTDETSIGGSTTAEQVVTETKKVDFPKDSKHQPILISLPRPSSRKKERGEKPAASLGEGVTVSLPRPPSKSTIKEINAEVTGDLMSPGSDEFDPRSSGNVQAQPLGGEVADLWGGTAKPAAKSKNPFASDADDLVVASEAVLTSSVNPFASAVEASVCKNPFADEGLTSAGESNIPFSDDSGLDIFGSGGENSGTEPTTASSFNPFATITEGEPPAAASESFDPFQTIHDDDAFEADFGFKSEDTESGEHQLSGSGSDQDPNAPPRFNPFDKEPPLDEKFANFEPQISEKTTETKSTPKFTSSESSFSEEDPNLEPLPPFHPKFEADGWKLLLRQPTKKKLTGNRFWKQVYVRIHWKRNVPTVKIFNNDRDKEAVQELALQACYTLHEMGLQQFDQFGKCHTVKIQYVFYRERPGVKADRITPTLSDLTRVRDFKGLRDLVHRPKTTMILEHAPQASELLKFGSLNFEDFKSFVWELEDAFFKLGCRRDKTLTYTKDEITVDVVDEYYLELDKDGHILYHKARVRAFCLAFLTGMPKVEIGMNEKRRRGKEVVGRHDIIPIKTEEWIKIEDPEFHSLVKTEEYEKNKVVSFQPLDACKFEFLRFRVRPRLNKELPLQIRIFMSVIERHVDIRGEVLIPGFFSSSRRASQTPCEDIQIRIPIPEPWFYFFRVEKRFRYGSIKSTTRKPGKIKGFERLTMIAQGMLPPSLIEVSSGQAKFENVFRAVVWRIARLPERNEGAYKTHLFQLKLDLGPHDVVPESFEKICHVEYNMPNSTVSRAQVRSISVETQEEQPDRWVHHLAKYEYTVEMEFKDKPDPVPSAYGSSPVNSPTSPVQDSQEGNLLSPEGGAEADREDSDSSSSDEE